MQYGNFYSGFQIQALRTLVNMRRKKRPMPDTMSETAVQPAPVAMEECESAPVPVCGQAQTVKNTRC
jgi:hypothetical protein